ncbi:MAG: FAD:protein FMN transferase, partial [Rhodothermales bacterium]|nr:FAD:protein FMN transferase [Rhodothermales bacterium]
MQTVRLAAMAMATRFELVVRGGRDPAWLRAAGEEALAEIHRLNDRLSFYSSSSDVARVNRLASREPVSVDAALFRLLEACRRLHRDTGGAFDVTVGPLMRCWGLADKTPRQPSDADLSAA